MNERWRKPIRMLAVEEDKDGADFIADRWHRGIAFTTDAEGLARIKAGRVCLHCGEPQETPFPEVCGLVGCGYRIRERQTKDMEIEFKGTKHLGPSTSLEEELARLDDWGERREHSPQSSLSVHGLWVPPGVSD